MSETAAEMAVRLGIRIPSAKPVRTQRCGRCHGTGLVWDKDNGYYVAAGTHEVHSCGSLRYVTNAYKQPTWKRGRIRR